MSKSNSTLTHERLRELAWYEPDAGIFRWRLSSSNRVKPWDVAGYIDAHTGYVRICIDSKLHHAHRLAWLYMTGEWPGVVDHINRCGLDNRWRNLRNGTQAQNMQNRSERDAAMTGVFTSSTPGKFTSKVVHNGAVYRLGQFDTKEGARAAYVAKKRQLHEFSTI